MRRDIHAYRNFLSKLTKNPNDEDICEEYRIYREESSYDAIADEDDE